MKPCRSWWKRPAVVVPLGVLAIIGTGIIGLKWTASSGMKRELDEIRKRGLPTDRVELDKWYQQSPANENAALLFSEASELHIPVGESKAINDFYWRDLRPGDPLPVEVAAAVENYLSQNQATLEKLHEGALRSRSRYPVDLAVKNFQIVHLAPVKSMAQLLRWDAVLKAEKGDAKGAARSLKTGFALAKSLEEEPIVISHLVRIAVLAIQYHAVESVINTVAFEEVDLSALAAAARNVEGGGKQALFRALAGERAFGMNSYDMDFQEYQQLITWGGMLPGDNDIPEVLHAFLFNTRRALGMQDSDLRFYMRAMGMLIKAAELKHPEMLRASEQAASEIEADLDRHPVRYLLSKLVLSAMLRINQKEALSVTRWRCAAMALEIELFRVRNGGKLPNAEDLAPSVIKETTRDPVDGKALEYQVGNGGKGYRIYAAGATEKERGGRTNSNVPEVVFRVVK